VDSAPIRSVIKHTAIKNLDIIPSNKDLVGAEVELVKMDERESRLKHAVAEIKKDYDYIFHRFAAIPGVPYFKCAGSC